MSLAAFGAHAGLAFQLTDDLLGIWGAPEVTGKPVGSDLRARKKSLPVVAALASGTDGGPSWPSCSAKPDPLTEDEVPRATGLVEAAGGRKQRTRRWPMRSWPPRLACLAAADMPEDVRAEFAGDRRVHHGAPMVTDDMLVAAATPAAAPPTRAAPGRHGRALTGRQPAGTERAVSHLTGAAGPGRLVAGRAGDQRHDGRRGPAAARVPRHPDGGGDRGGGALDQVPAASRRDLGELPRRRRRPVHHGRGVRGAAAGRRCARAPRT